jgi:hypothetical protein
MVRCNHCHTEYGGIRGISIDSCPRCKQQESLTGLPHSRPSGIWNSIEAPLSNWSPPPLAGPIAQLDRAVRV